MMTITGIITYSKTQTKKRETWFAWKAKAEALNLCGRCKKEPRKDGRQSCQTCIDKASASIRARREAAKARAA